MGLAKKWGHFRIPKDVNLAIAQEWVAPDEEQLHQKLVEMLKGTIEKRDKNSLALRSVHPKDHGCLRAEFIVEPNLPDNLKIGVFKEAKSFAAWIRYSTASGAMSSDAEKGFLGMAIKLMDVSGKKLLEDEQDETTQDFLLISVPNMPVRNAVDFAKLIDATKSGNPLKFFLNPFDLHLKEFKVAVKTKRQNVNPLYLLYNSTVPYLLGDGQAVKYRCDPTTSFTEKMPAKLTPNYFREAMQAHLNKKEFRFDFMVQLQTDPVSMPIEDALADWDEQASPYQKVATIVIPSQDFNVPERLELAEHLSFHPWHSLPEHRPLGSLNRARKVVYSEISRFRHKRNEIPRREPNGNDQNYPKDNA